MERLKKTVTFPNQITNKFFDKKYWTINVPTGILYDCLIQEIHPTNRFNIKKLIGAIKYKKITKFLIRVEDDRYLLVSISNFDSNKLEQWSYHWEYNLSDIVDEIFYRVPRLDWTILQQLSDEELEMLSDVIIKNIENKGQYF